ncbi:MAG: hypothetical protein GF307_10835, partial [candidate division Zixibacteria bacterium]|nr:hypothetical protein [candidate division Zixibacteria bacterium]
MKQSNCKLTILLFAVVLMLSLTGCDGDNATNSIVNQISGTWNITVRLDDGQQSSAMEFEWIFVQTGNEVDVKYTEFSGSYANNLLILDGEAGNGSTVHIEAVVSGDVV